MTPLHLAVKEIEYLVGKEADIINRQDRDGVNNSMCDCIMMKDYMVRITFWSKTTISRHMRKYIGIASSVF